MTLREIVENGTPGPWYSGEPDQKEVSVYCDHLSWPLAAECTQNDARKIVLAVNVLPELLAWKEARDAMSWERFREADEQLNAAILRELSR